MTDEDQHDVFRFRDIARRYAPALEALALMGDGVYNRESQYVDEAALQVIEQQLATIDEHLIPTLARYEIPRLIATVRHLRTIYIDHILHHGGENGE